MDRPQRISQEIQPEKRRSVIADRVDCAAVWVYQSIRRGPLGRLCTSYRSVETRWQRDRRRVGRGAYRPASAARRQIRETAERGLILRALRAVGHYLFTCPLSFYGLLGVFYSLFGVATYFFPQLASMHRSFPVAYLWIYLAMALFSFPLIFSSKTLAHALGSGICARWLFVHVLGIPENGLLHNERQSHRMFPYIALLLGLLAALATWWIHPLIIPAVLLGFGLLGMIFAYPETGVVLTTLLLPVVCLGRQWLICPIAVILVTWVSFGVKWVLMHVPVRWGLLDIAVLIFQLILLASGIFGSSVTPRGIAESVLTFILLSVYFLIRQLVTDRAQVKRCLTGAALSAILIVLLGVLRTLPEGGLNWMGGSPAGTVLVNGVNRLHAYLLSAWSDMALALVLLFLPFLCMRMATPAHPIRYVIMALFGVLTLAVVLLWGTPALWISMIGCMLIYAFLYTHRTLTVTMVAVLPVGCLLWWLSALAPKPTDAVMQTLFAGDRLYRETLHGQVWRMVMDHPGGIGWGRDAFVSHYAAYADSVTRSATGCQSLYLEILTAMGWPGLITFAVVMFLFAQKMLTCARYTGQRQDRRTALVGLSAVAGVLILGSVRGLLYEPLILFGWWVVFSLTSAFADVALEDNDELMTRPCGETCRDDRIFYVGS